MSDRSKTTGTDASWSPAAGRPSTHTSGNYTCGHPQEVRLAGPHRDQPPPVWLVDVVSGPHTIAALGEDCLVCEEGLEPGQVYVFCRDATGSGVAHESCVDNAGQALLL